MKQDTASDLGVSTAQVGDVLNTLFSGVVVGQYEEGQDRYDVRVRLGEGQRQNIGASTTSTSKASTGPPAEAPNRWFR